MLAKDAYLVAVDFESTGAVSGYPDEPWQIGVVPVVGGRVVMDQAYESYLRVPADRPFNPVAPGSWGTVRSRLAVAPTLAGLLPQLRPYLDGRALIAHNAATERKFFRSAWPLHRPGPWIDTLKIARVAYPGLEAYSLEAVISRLGLDGEIDQLVPGRGAHDALFDAVACGLVLCRLLREAEWASVTVDDLTRAARSPRR